MEVKLILIALFIINIFTDLYVLISKQEYKKSHFNNTLIIAIMIGFLIIHEHCK